VTYGILQSRKVFEDLGTFTLAHGLREVRRAQLAKEEHAKRLDDPKGKGKGHAEEIELGDPGAEKSRLLQSEGANVSRSSQEEDDLEAGGSPHLSAIDDSLVLSDNPYGSPISEKARGKMRERRSASVETLNALDRVPIEIGRNGFVPSQEWVTSWQQGCVFLLTLDYFSQIF